MIAKNIEIVEMDKEWIIMDAENYTVTKVNAVGAEIVAALMARQSIEKIIKNIQFDYRLDEQLVRADVSAFIEELKGVGLIPDDRN
jgi:hypothetical protein